MPLSGPIILVAVALAVIAIGAQKTAHAVAKAEHALAAKIHHHKAPAPAATNRQ